MTEAPFSPGVGPPPHQPVRFGRFSGGTWIVWSALRPSFMIGELSPSFGIRSREGTERASGLTRADAWLDSDGAGRWTTAECLFPPLPQLAAVTATSATAVTTTLC